MNKPISFELAKLVSEREISCSDERYAYNDKGELVDPMSQVWHCEAPTIGDMVTHLYETYGIWVSVYEYRDHAADNNEKPVFRTRVSGTKEYKSPNEAYEYAIKCELNKLCLL